MVEALKCFKETGDVASVLGVIGLRLDQSNPLPYGGDEMFLTSDSICSFCSTEALISSLENCFLNTDSYVLLSIPAGSEAECVLCGETKDFEKQIFCTSCGRHYHGSCLEPSVDLTPVVRMGWQCPDCKVCQGCRFVD